MLLIIAIIITSILIIKKRLQKKYDVKLPIETWYEIIRTPENPYICKVPRCLANIEKKYVVRIYKCLILAKIHLM